MEISFMENYFSKRMYELRKRKGISAREMSLSLGQSTSYINNIENKRNLPSMSAFFNICAYFGITPQEFFYDEATMPKVPAFPPMLDELISNLKQLEDDQLMHLNAIAKDMKRE